MKRVNQFLVAILFFASKISFATVCKIKDEGKLFTEAGSKTIVDCDTFGVDGDVVIETGSLRASGGFSHVFEGTYSTAINTRTINVVIKRIHLKGMRPVGYGGLEENEFGSSVESVDAELASMVSLYKHASLQPYLVRPYAYFTIADNAFIVMEDGGLPLKHFSKSFRENTDEFATATNQIIGAVTLFALAGYAHLDIKPDNFLFSSLTKQIKIIDFGFVKKFGEYKAIEVGDLNYRDPNVYHKNSNRKFVLDKAYDEFSTAMVFYELLYDANLFARALDVKNLNTAIRPDTDDYERYVEKHLSDVRECKSQTKKCDRWTLKLLHALHPERENRIPLIELLRPLSGR